MKRFLFAIIFFLACNGVFAEITAQVDSSKVQMGQTIRLTITMENAQNVGLNSLTPLAKDFSIISTQRSLSYSMINGQSRSISQWTIYLSPKKTGTLQIPPLTIGQEQTKALQIEVTEEAVPEPQETNDNIQTNNPSVSDAQEVMLKTEISKENPWINQQVLYTVKLYNSSQRLLDAQYSPPRIDNALLVPLGEGRRYQSVENGRSYNVEEQRYAIFPQKSGTLELIAPSLQALLFDTIPRRINANGKNIKLNVQPIPAQYNGKYWVPAKQFKLSEEYDKKGNAVHEGSTVVRTITIEGTGVPAQLLPTLSFQNGQDFNTYPEKPEVQNTVQGQDLVGTSTIKVTYLFNQQGSVTIPALQIPWFNTTTGKEEIAELPSYTLTVTPKVGASSSSATPLTTVSKENAQPKEPKKISQPTSTTSDNLVWGLGIGFVVACLLMFILGRLKPMYISKVKPSKAKKKLQQACSQHDPVLARNAVLDWARAEWPDEEFLNLNDVMHRVHNVQIKKHLHLLSQVLYSQNKDANWQGRELLDAINSYRHKNAPARRKVNDLPPINPIDPFAKE